LNKTGAEVEGSTGRRSFWENWYLPKKIPKPEIVAVTGVGDGFLVAGDGRAILSVT